MFTLTGCDGEQFIFPEVLPEISYSPNILEPAPVEFMSDVDNSVIVQYAASAGQRFVNRLYKFRAESYEITMKPELFDIPEMSEEGRELMRSRNFIANINDMTDEDAAIFLNHIEQFSLFDDLVLLDHLNDAEKAVVLIYLMVVSSGLYFTYDGLVPEIVIPSDVIMINSELANIWIFNIFSDFTFVNNANTNNIWMLDGYLFFNNHVKDINGVSQTIAENEGSDDSSENNNAESSIEDLIEKS